MLIYHITSLGYDFNHTDINVTCMISMSRNMKEGRVRFGGPIALSIYTKNMNRVTGCVLLILFEGGKCSKILEVISEGTRLLISR